MIKVYILKKTHTRTGNPNYKLLIPGLKGKVEGLRKHKDPFTYGIVSYNLGQDLRTYVFPGKRITLIDER